MNPHENANGRSLWHRPNNVIIPPAAVLVASGDTTSLSRDLLLYLFLPSPKIELDVKNKIIPFNVWPETSQRQSVWSRDYKDEREPDVSSLVSQQIMGSLSL